MKRILKGPNSLVRRVLSKTSNDSRSSSSEQKSTAVRAKKSFMSEQDQLAQEIKVLKNQIDNLKGAVKSLQCDTEKKEVAIAKIAREKEQITMELLKQKRSNNNLVQQLEDERKFYYKEKEVYCHEMNQFKKLKQTLSSTTTGTNHTLSVEQYKEEIATVKETLRQTLEANYNLSIKFLRMKNTKTCLKTQLKTMQLEHEKLINDYKTKILNLSEELNGIIQERLNTPISCSSKKYLHLVKHNSCLVYENLCLQLEVDNLRLKYEKLKIDKTKSEGNNRLKYIKHESAKPKQNVTKDHKKVRIKDERPEKDVVNLPSTGQSYPLESQFSKEKIVKIFERNRLPGTPDIKLLSDFDSNKITTDDDARQIPSVQEKDDQNAKRDSLIKNVLGQAQSKLALFQVSNISSRASTVITTGGLLRTQSSPEITRFSSDSNAAIR